MTAGVTREKISIYERKVCKVYDLRQEDYSQSSMYRAVRDAGVRCGMLVIGGRTNIEVR